MGSPLTYLLVDGHNVMHAWPELKQLQRQASRRHQARQQLLQRLRHLQDMTGTRVVVVFDGTQSQGSEEREPEGLQIFYAAAGATADRLIERLAAKYAPLHRLRVASADGLVRETVLACGADWLSPETLRLECEAAESAMRDRL